MLADYNITPVKEEEFEKMPIYLRMGLTTQKANEALLGFGKKSNGDRQFEFLPADLSPLERKVKPILRRLERIVVLKSGGIHLKWKSNT